MINRCCYHNNEFYTPIFKKYSEREFGGEFETEAEYKTIEVKCLICLLYTSPSPRDED